LFIFLLFQLIVKRVRIRQPHNMIDVEPCNTRILWLFR